MNKKNIVIFIVLLLVVVFLKYPFVDEIIHNSELPFYTTLIATSKNNFVNFIWFIPIMLNIFVVSKDIYYKLINFDQRYKNRHLYFKTKIKENFILHLLISCITAIGQWILFAIILKTNIIIGKMIIIFFFKYVIELYLVSIIILMISLLVSNYIYTFIFILLIIHLLINSVKLFYIPFISLYVKCNLNIIDIFILIELIILTNKIYKRLDLGGIKNEIDN